MFPQQVITFIIGTIVILFGAYYVTYYIGMKASGQRGVRLNNRNIRLIDRYAIARDKCFCIVEIAGKVYIIGVTNHSMTLLDTFDAAAFAELAADDREMPAWNKTPVGQYGNKLTKKLVMFIAEKTGRKQQSDGEISESEFAASLKTAQQAADDASEKKEESGKPDHLKSEQTENPEDD